MTEATGGSVASRGEYLSPGEPATEAQQGEFVAIINDIARAWRLRRSIATVQEIINRDAGAAS